MKIYLFISVILLLGMTVVNVAEAEESTMREIISGVVYEEEQSKDADSTGDNWSFTSAIDKDENGWWQSQSKENKMLYTNLIAATVIGIWGMEIWDYGSADFHTYDEGWFGQDTQYGGSDKLGHFWATYTFSDALTGLYNNWGYTAKEATIYGAFSAWSVQAFMELCDGMSETQGFSWPDLAMNTLGALTSVLMQKYPDLDRKIDFRVEYVFNTPGHGIFDDYSNHYYSIAFKLEGFDAIENTFFKYLELHAGYYTSGYEDHVEEDKRSLYAGVSLNFSRLFNETGYHKTGKVLEYIQPPYTVLKMTHSLD